MDLSIFSLQLYMVPIVQLYISESLMLIEYSPRPLDNKI